MPLAIHGVDESFRTPFNFFSTRASTSRIPCERHTRKALTVFRRTRRRTLPLGATSPSGPSNPAIRRVRTSSRCLHAAIE
jgi:hypothetical protein